MLLRRTPSSPCASGRRSGGRRVRGVARTGAWLCAVVVLGVALVACSSDDEPSLDAVDSGSPAEQAPDAAGDEPAGGDHDESGDDAEADASGDSASADDTASAGPVVAVTSGYGWDRAGARRLEPDTTFAVTDFGAVADDDGDDTDAFLAAIDAARDSGGIVAIPTGDFLVTSTLQLGNRTVLRGTGPGSRLTFDLRDADIEAIVAQGAGANDDAWQAVGADLAVGDTTVPVADTSLFVVGDLVELEQDNDRDAMVTKPEWDVEWGRGSVGEVAEIVAIGDGTVTLDGGIRSPYATDRSARIRRFDAVRHVGIESLAIVRTDDGYGNTIAFRWAGDVWVDGVVSTRTTRAHVALDQVGRCDVIGSIIHDASDFGDGGRAYGVSVARHTTGCLVADNTLYDLRHALIIQLGASGNVFAYNHARGSAGYEDRQPRADISLHGHWPQANLFEGNIVDRVVFADWWGPSGPGNTLFRNCVLESVVVTDSSDDQVIAANTIGVGGLTIDDDISGTVLAANSSDGGDLAADATSGDAASLPPSLWTTEPPAFLAGADWPPIEPGGGCDLPASDASPLGNR